jgi:hypothetical protein
MESVMRRVASTGHIYEATVEMVTVDTWTKFIRAVPIDIRGSSESWAPILAQPHTKVKGVSVNNEGNIKDEEGAGQTTTTTTPPLIETEGIEVSPFVPMPNLWDNLQFNPLPREEAMPSEASGEGESIVSGSKPDRDEEFYFCKNLRSQLLDNIY